MENQQTPAAAGNVCLHCIRADYDLLSIGFQLLTACPIRRPDTYNQERFEEAVYAFKFIQIHSNSFQQDAVTRDCQPTNNRILDKIISLPLHPLPYTVLHYHYHYHHDITRFIRVCALNL